MSHRTQILLTDSQYEHLNQEAKRTGVGLGELIRRAINLVYNSNEPETFTSALEASFGAWKDRDFDGATYVEQFRHGMGHRLR